MRETGYDCSRGASTRGSIGPDRLKIQPPSPQLRGGADPYPKVCPSDPPSDQLGVSESLFGLNGNPNPTRIGMNLLWAASRLPEHYRDAVIHRDICELNTLTVARILNLSVQNVRARLLRARSTLRKFPEPIEQVRAVRDATRLGSRMTLFG